MINGIDTTFLVECEVSSHKHHAWARRRLEMSLAQGDKFALTPQVLSEFIHVTTDAKRFTHPLSIAEAVAVAKSWWSATEVVQLHPTPDSTTLFLTWMHEHRLGRKRILDTMLAATFYAQGVKTLFTTNSRDYSIFDCFEIVSPT